ncbi:polyamine-transporting ATPase 13A3-like [Amphiura filiformis]|uniref:polyamine-transporting ATPase 13A3-like n=1 Tax=Amphiura filiformis TaxID=82378 RepID=UPI003B21EE45
MAEKSHVDRVGNSSFRRSLEPLLIEANQLDPIKCWGYCRNTLRTVITYVLCVLSLGFLVLVFYWKPNWKLKIMYVKCHLSRADAVLIQDVYQREHVKFIQSLKVNDESTVTPNDLELILRKDVLIQGELRFFCYQKLKYIWDAETWSFFVLRAPELHTSCEKLCRELQSGLSIEKVKARREIFGLNKLTIAVKPILVMLVQEVLNPFYAFQVFCVAVWLGFEFWTFTTVIIVMTLITLGTSLYAVRKQSITLQEMTESYLKVEVLRPDGNTVTEMEDQLVPGDVIIIPPSGCIMTCDAVLTNGTCVVNESMLTGESVPVTKVPLSSQKSASEQNDIYSPERHRCHTLFCGTQVIQTRQSGNDMVKAVVVQTGFSTMKGTLVCSILFPRPMEFKLYRDAMMFVGAFIALDRTRMSVLLTLDGITIAINPLLPVALTIGMLYAQIRLKKQYIFCISPQRINLSGVLDVVCFDKTGTLTEDGLDLLGLRSVTDNVFSSMESTATSLPPCPFLHTMVTCHSLAIINGTIQGDPMDVKMFEATGWTLEEMEGKVDSGSNQRRQVTSVKPSINLDQHASEFAILKQFTFSSALQRMSVIAQSQPLGELAGFVKGSPEMIASLCNPDTVPEGFSTVLDSYTSEGFRVLALAWKPLTDDTTSYQNITRDELESDLTFLGILIWQNKLKPESLPVINELQTSNIRTIMVTGDNILTAISVAGQCGMVSANDTVIQVYMPPADETSKDQLEYKTIIQNIAIVNDGMATNEEDGQETLMRPTSSTQEHYVLDGKTFAYIQDRCPQELPTIVLKGTIFARMAPNQKQELVESLQEMEYCVGMCGDGANDCGALKTAHAGISLSEAEASVASPFTSKIPNITCVPILIKEGRSALVTSFGLFKYLAMYTYIWYITVGIFKWFGTYSTNNMATFWGIALGTPVVLLMGRSGPYDKIADTKPPTRLIRAPTMFSMIFHVSILTITQAAAVFMVRGETWYTYINVVTDEGVSGGNFYQNWETTAVFLIANFQYVIYCVLFTPVRPYQKPIWKNPLYLIYLVVIMCACSFWLLAPLEKLEDYLWGIQHIPEFKFRVMLFLLFLANAVVSFVVEFLVIPRKTFQKFLRCWRKESLPKFETMRLDMQMSSKPVSEQCCLDLEN